MAQETVLGTDTLDQQRIKINSAQLSDPNTQTGTSYTLVLADAGKVVEMNNAGSMTLTVPPNSSVAFPAGTIIGVYRMGAGSLTIAQGSGVTIRNAGSLRAQFSEASLRKRATDEWVLAGDLT